MEGAEDDMSFFFTQNLVADSRRSCKMLLALLWCIGLICGISLAACTDTIASLMRACCDAGVSIVGLFFVPFVPFLISAIAVYCSIPLFIYVSGLAKSFLFGFCTCAVLAAFSDGGWLTCLLLLFTDLLTIPVLYLFQLRCLRDGVKDILSRGVYTVAWFAVVSSADYLWIAPLLRDII